MSNMDASPQGLDALIQEDVGFTSSSAFRAAKDITFGGVSNFYRFIGIAKPTICLDCRDGLKNIRTSLRSHKSEASVTGTGFHRTV